MDTERREHPRFPVSALVDFTGSELLLQQPLVDLSLGGLGLTCSLPEAPGQRVDLVMDLDRINITLAVQGEVRWCAGQGPVRVGVAFVGLDVERTRVLQRYLQAVAEALA